ncbi:putative acyl-coa dehydrogenase ibr3 [Quercus suber]|uniref:Acyl-coa dehydrogenase ibr3 n=1 Tax=Quercus suber TaxID=58331 RepID=A0AAW0K6D8_QUESU
MTEPQVASSDATNIESSIKREGDTYVINGTKWWTSGAMDPRCKVLIVMGKTDFTAAKHKQQSMIIVDTHTPGVHIRRPLMVFGFDDAPHGHAEVSFVNVRVPAKNILLGEGRGFEIAQGRLGPGRLHHCMRLIGAAERGMQMMAQRALKKQGSFISDIAKCRIEIEKARLLALEAADQLDKLGNKKAQPQVASSDATNIESSIKREGDTYVINGTKWWTSGAMDPRCKVLIVMGKTDFTAAKHKQQSMIIVDTHTPGVHIRRPLMVFGFDDAPHGHAEVSFVNVRVPAKNILLGEGRGFEIAQGRLGPGRLHHCMRLIGAAERGMQMMAQRALKSVWKCRIEIEKARLLALEAADQLDKLGNKKARGIYCNGQARTLRIANGPDEVHLGTIGKLELQRTRL